MFQESGSSQCKVMERQSKLKTMHKKGKPEWRKKRRETRSKQITPLCDMMARFRWGREGGLNSLKGINERATGGQRISGVKWSLGAAKEDCAYR